MENNDLNNKVLTKVRNRIVMSNLEREERMRINKKKQIISLTAVIMLFISGGFVTANANTNGQLLNNIKDTIKVKVVKNGEEQEVKEDSYTDSNGDTWITYKTKTEDSETETKINKSELDKQNMKIEEKINENTTNDSAEEVVELNITEKK